MGFPGGFPGGIIQGGHRGGGNIIINNGPTAAGTLMQGAGVGGMGMGVGFPVFLGNSAALNDSTFKVLKEAITLFIMDHSKELG